MLHLIDDSCSFSEQFIFCCDLTGPYTEVTICAGGESLPNPNFRIYEYLTLKDHGHILP